MHHGTCELCGAEDRDLWRLSLAEWNGWACAKCLQQVANSQERKFCRFLEQTEEAE